MEAEESLAHIDMIAEQVDLKLGLCDPGSTDIGAPDAEGLPVGMVYSNSYDDTHTALAQCERLRIGPSLAIYKPVGCARRSLFQVVNKKGGGLNALGRQTVAALLNAASTDDLTQQEVIDMLNQTHPGTKASYNTLKDNFESFNVQVCPLN